MKTKTAKIRESFLASEVRTVSVNHVFENGWIIFEKRSVKVDAMGDGRGASHFSDGMHGQLRCPNVDGGHSQSRRHNRTDSGTAWRVVADHKVLQRNA